MNKTTRPIEMIPKYKRELFSYNRDGEKVVVSNSLALGVLEEGQKRTFDECVKNVLSSAVSVISAVGNRATMPSCRQIKVQSSCDLYEGRIPTDVARALGSFVLQRLTDSRRMNEIQVGALISQMAHILISEAELIRQHAEYSWEPWEEEEDAKENIDS